MYEMTDWTIAQFRQGIHHATALAKTILKVNIVVKIISFSLPLITVFPQSSAYYNPLNDTINTTKLYLNFMKGMRSFDWLVNGEDTTWKVMSLNIAGLFLFTFSTLNILEKLKLINLNPIHQKVAKFPLFGVLPYAGIPKLALIILNVFLASIAFNKENNLKKEQQHIHEKISFWSAPLTDVKIKQKLKLSTDDSKKAKWLSFDKLFQENQSTAINEICEAKKILWETRGEKIQKNLEIGYLYQIRKIISIAAIIILSTADIAQYKSTAMTCFKFSAGLIDITLNCAEIMMKQ